VSAPDRQERRERTLRARNRALFAVVAAVAVLLYAVTLVRIAGY
jgi:hypothetical protein